MLLGNSQAKKNSGSEHFDSCSRCSYQPVARVGLEPSQDSPEKTELLDESGAQTGALPGDQTFSALIQSVARLTAEQRTALADMLKRSEGGG